MDLSADLRALLPRWRIDGADLLPPEEPAQIEALFARLGQPATPEVLTLYTTLGGMAMMDGEFWQLWSLKQIEEENQGPPSPWGVLFSDYLINSHVYRLRTTADGSSSEVFADFTREDISPVRVAASLHEFFALYRSDPDQVVMLR